MEENICKQKDQWEINLQNTQIAYAAQHQKTQPTHSKNGQI